MFLLVQSTIHSVNVCENYINNFNGAGIDNERISWRISNDEQIKNQDDAVGHVDQNFNQNDSFSFVQKAPIKNVNGQSESNRLIPKHPIDFQPEWSLVLNLEPITEVQRVQDSN